MASEKSPLLSNQADLNSQKYAESSNDESDTGVPVNFTKNRKKRHHKIKDADAEREESDNEVQDGEAHAAYVPVSPIGNEFTEEETHATYVSVPPIGPDDLPPPYSPSPHGVPMITCKVCGFMIDITGRREQHVVKCSSCNEATPIKSAPPGKKYVRCPCQCLLICKSSSQRISCPRTNCKKILNLAPLAVNPLPPSVPGMCQVSCAHCRSLFLFNTLTNALARCPHCRKVSSVGAQFAQSRGIMYLIAAFLFLIIGLGVTFGTLSHSQRYKVLYAVDACLFLAFVWLFFKSVYYFSMKISSIEGPA